jgi:hypothetical protein
MIKPATVAGVATIAAAAAVAVAGAMILLDGNGNDGDSAADLPPATPSAADGESGSGGGGGGDGPFLYPQPEQVAPGHREWPLSSMEARQRGGEAFNAAKDKPQFEGVVNGIRLWSFEHAFRDASVERKVCGGGEFAEGRVVDRLTFDYLPPGTSAFGPQSEGICEDGSVEGTGQMFVADVPTFTIYYQPGERAFGQDAAADRIEPATVQGQPGVIIRPLTEEGFGRTWVAFATPNGMIVVEASDMPLDEALKIAEGVRCADC